MPNLPPGIGPQAPLPGGIPGAPATPTVPAGIRPQTSVMALTAPNFHENPQPEDKPGHRDKQRPRHPRFSIHSRPSSRHSISCSCSSAASTACAVARGRRTARCLDHSSCCFGSSRIVVGEEEAGVRGGEWAKKRNERTLWGKWRGIMDSFWESAAGGGCARSIWEWNKSGWKSSWNGSRASESSGRSVAGPAR